MEGGDRKINLSIIDLPSLLRRAKQMKCIGRNRFYLRWKTEGSFHVRGRDSPSLFKWDRQSTNQSVCHDGAEHVIGASSINHHLRHKLPYQRTADRTENRPDEKYLLSGEQNFIF